MPNFLSTERLARASARRPWTTLAAWLVLFLAAGVAVAALLGSALTSDDDFTNEPEAKRADSLIATHFPGGVSEDAFEADLAVVVRSARHAAGEPAFERRLDAVHDALTSVSPPGAVVAVRQGEPDLVSPDGRAAMILLDLGAYPDGYPGRLMDAVAAEDGVRGFEVGIAGRSVVEVDFDRTAASDLKRAELIGLGAAFVVLLLVFGTLVASLVPILVAVVSIVVALGLTAVVGQAWELAFFVVNMLVMMGLAVGVDYSLFVVSRFREERAGGRERLEAIARAGATSSRAVLFSGMTVVLALVGMFVVPQTIFRSLAAGAILVVLVAVAAALTLLPALLALLGDRVDALRVRLPWRGSFWGPVAEAVMRRPGVSLAASAALLIGLALPVVGIQTGSAGVSTLPDDFVSKRGFTLVDESFGVQDTATAEILVEGDAAGAGFRGAVDSLERLLAADGRFGRPTTTVAPEGGAALLSVPVAGDPTGRAAIDAVRDLRGEHIPEAFEGAPARALVTGATAGELDFHDLAADYLPLVFGLVLTLSVVLLVAAFRAPVVAGTAIVANLLSVGAAYGLLVTAFGTVEAWLPLFLFSILFGLSMDYHVFLLSRIRERYETTWDTRDAVSFGIRSTGRLITGAALIMVAVFAGFATGELVMFQQMGFGLGAAVLLDATVVRAVFVPAAMKLLGRWNWWTPGVLGRKPRLAADEA